MTRKIIIIRHLPIWTILLTHKGSVRLLSAGRNNVCRDWANILLSLMANKIVNLLRSLIRHLEHRLKKKQMRKIELILMIRANNLI